MSGLDPLTLSFFDLFILPAAYLLAALVVVLLVGAASAIASGNLRDFVDTSIRTVRGVWAQLRSLRELALRLRVFWPLLVLGAVFAAGVATQAIQMYLFDIRQQWHSCNVDHSINACGPPFNQNETIFWLDTAWPHYLERTGALAAATLALLATIAAVALVVVRPREHSWVLGSEARAFIRARLAFLGGLFALSFWMFSLILSLGNWIGLAVIHALLDDPSQLATFQWAPFIQPDPLALLSLAAFMVFVFRGRSPGSREQSKDVGLEGAGVVGVVATPEHTQRE
jgi:hypothetical protein